MSTAVNPIYGSYKNIPAFDPMRKNKADAFEHFTQADEVASALGDQINNSGLAQQEYYGNRQVGQAGLIDPALEELRNTPGYNPDESQKIGVDYTQFKTPDWAIDAQALSGDEQDAMKQGYINAQLKAEKGNADQGAMLNQYQGNLGGQVDQYGRYVKSGLDTLGSGLNSATGQLDERLQGAQGKFGKLDAAVNDAGLEFDPNGTMKQLTDADVQNIKSAAGRRVGNMYQNEADDAVRRAAAAGTSPMAVAAARGRLANSAAAAMGDSESDAYIKALQAQYDRASGIEGQRLGAEQTQAGMRAGAATTEQAAAQDAALQSGRAGIEAAGLLGTQTIGAARDVGQAGIDAANQYGQYSTNTVGQMTDRATQAATNSAANQNAVILNNQDARKGMAQTRYGQGVDTAKANAQGAQAIGDKRVAGQAAYRSGVTEQQGMAQQGGQKAVDQQNTAYGTRAGALSANAANRGQFDNAAPGALGKTGSQLLGAIAGVASSYAGAPHAEGGMAAEDTLATVGERGPEVVYGRYAKTNVDSPTTVLLEAGDRVVPKNNNPKNKTAMRYRCAA
jgi:hypothetical protein